MTAWRLVAALLLAALLGACTTPPAPPASSAGDAGEATAPLRPLARLPVPPPDAPPRSAVASVRYDLAVSGRGELIPDDGVPGDEGPRDVFERGGASWYGIQFHNRKTANGERFDMGDMTAAHKTLPFNTRVCVRSLVNGREVLVRINDRGPYAGGRIIDLSRAAADAIGMLGLGIKQVALSIVGMGAARCGGVDVPSAVSADPVAPRAERQVPTRRKAGVPRGQ